MAKPTDNTLTVRPTLALLAPREPPPPKDGNRRVPAVPATLDQD
ncbi:MULTISPECIES: hypothetical protein [unclassified Streptomyces]|nr:MULTISPECIES: hypothetical protein [unclassified Streptomyces]